MLIQSLELNNIGPYEGYNFFDLKTNSNKNTILIGGKNGSGKTTFLNSVRLALYGPLAFGFKTPTSKYINKIETILNNNAKQNSPNSNFHIKISFEIVEDFKRTNIELTRQWIPTNSTIKEVVNIVKEKQPLNEIERDNFLSKLKVYFPPSLLELCFFDGEDLTKLTDDKYLSQYLRELTEKLFNLDLFRSLELNLKRYLSESTQSTIGKQLEEEKNLIEAKLNEKRMELYNSKKLINQLYEQLEEIKIKYRQTRDEFSTHGGLLYIERENIQKEIINLENKRKQVNDSIKDFIAYELPFFISLPILQDLVIQLDKEENYYISSMIDQKLNQISFTEISKELDIHIDEQQEKALLNLLRKALSGQSGNINIIHNASKTETHQVHSLLNSLTKKRLNEIYQLIESNNDDLIKISQLNKKLKTHQNTREFKDMIILMENYSKRMNELESEINALLMKENILEEEVKQLTIQFDKISKELHNLYKKKSSLDLTRKIIKVSEKFQQKQLRNKVKDIEYFSTKMIRDLLRKKYFIKQIYIHPETFEISLYDFDNREINKKILSAGEKELLILSIIWGTIHASKKEIPFVLDTLLGRLDLEHKTSVINKLVPKFGKQIMILSTNSEITDNLFQNLSPYIANYYTLNFDQSEERTKIENHFFNLTLNEVHT